MDWLNSVAIPALSTGCLYALVATGFNVLEKSTRVLNFAHGYLIMWAPMGALVLLARGVPAWMALPAGVVIAIGFGLIVEIVAIRPFVGESQALPWILSTLGASIILGQIAALPFQAAPQAFEIGFSRLPTYVGGIRISPQSILLIASAAACYLLLASLYRFTRLGRMLTAVAEDLDGARVLGISPGRMSQVAAGLAAGVAAVTGLVVAPLLLVSPQLGLGLTFTGFVTVALGGVGSLRGGVVAGIMVGFVIQLVAVYVGSVWTNTALFGVLLIVYLVRPWGLFGVPPTRAV